MHVSVTWLLHHSVCFTCVVTKFIDSKTAFLHRNHEMKKYLLEMKGLDMLTDLLRRRSSPFYTSAVLGACNLARSLSITFPTTDKYKRVAMEASDADRSFTAADEDVTFMFDDGSWASAVRSVLVSSSDVFAAMLAGHYSESNASMIRIPHVSPAAFRLLLRAAPMDRLPPPDVASCNPLPHDLLLELLALADRYLFVGLLHDVSEGIAADLLDAATVAEIFDAATAHNAHWLASECIRFILLSHSLALRVRCTTVAEIIAGQAATEFVGAMSSLLAAAIMM